MFDCTAVSDRNLIHFCASIIKGVLYLGTNALKNTFDIFFPHSYDDSIFRSIFNFYSPEVVNYVIFRFGIVYWG